MDNFKVNGLNVYDYGGDGKPLVFVHAFPMCSRMWDAQVNFFRKKFRVITYDVRGLGYSTGLDNYIFTMEEHVNDFFNFLSHLNIKKVNACGLSMGGYILLRAVLREENWFESIVLADTRASGENNYSLLGRSDSIIRIKSGGREDFIDGFVRKLLSEESYQNEKIRDFVRMIAGWADSDGLCSNLIAIATRTNSFYLLDKINIPALVICGRQDALTPVIDSFYLKEGIRNSTFKVIENAGHLSNIEKPDEFNSSMLEFLTSLK